MDKYYYVPVTSRHIKFDNLSFTESFSNSLEKLAEKDDKIVAITAAMMKGTGLTTFAHRYPDRFFDVGIAEQHAVRPNRRDGSKRTKTSICSIFFIFTKKL